MKIMICFQFRPWHARLHKTGVTFMKRTYPDGFRCMNLRGREGADIFLTVERTIATKKRLIGCLSRGILRLWSEVCGTRGCGKEV